MSMKKQRGLSLLETLISMVIIMFGVLGIAGMQLYAVNNTEVARYKNVATVIASSLAAKIQANTGYWGSPPASLQVNGSTITNGPAAYAGGCTNVVCTASQMAYTDLLKFGTDMALRLPSGNATITCSQTLTPAVCTIAISWSEKNIALTGASGGAGGLATGSNTTNSYQTLVSIPL
jgi:type IV pilus assembly protein PilV